MRYPEPISSAFGALRQTIKVWSERLQRTKTVEDSNAEDPRLKQIIRELTDKDEIDPDALSKALKERQRQRERRERRELLEEISDVQEQRAKADVNAKKEMLRTESESYFASLLHGANAAIEMANERYCQAVTEPLAIGWALGDHGLVGIRKRTFLSQKGTLRNGFQPIGEKWQSTIEEITKLRAAITAALKEEK